MLFVDCILYLLLAIYLDQVLPGKATPFPPSVTLYPEFVRALYINVALVFAQVSIEWGGLWCTSWSRPIGPKVKNTMWKSVQHMTRRCTALPGGASPWSRFPLSLEEKKPSGKSITSFQHALTKFFLNHLLFLYLLFLYYIYIYMWVLFLFWQHQQHPQSVQREEWRGGGSERWLPALFFFPPIWCQILICCSRNNHCSGFRMLRNADF